MKNALLSLLFLAVLSLASFFAYEAYQNSNAYISIQKELSQNSGVNKSLHSKLNKIIEKLSIGILDNYSQDRQKIEVLKNQASHLESMAKEYSYYFFGTIAIFLLIFWIIDRNFFIIYLALSSMISLVFALLSPLVTMMVYQSLPILGEVTLSFESKSIISTIQKLFVQKNYLIFFLVLIFSIVIPLFKSVVLLIYGFLKETHKGEKIISFINKIGKWSMADVFIVALLVVFFSTKQEIHTLLKLEVGVYFFIFYVLLSMMGSNTVNK